MSFRENTGCIIPTLVVLFFPCLFYRATLMVYVCVVFVVLCIYIWEYRQLCNDKESCLKDERYKYHILQEKLNQTEGKLLQLDTLLKSKIPYSLVGKMYSDIHSVIFDEDINLMIRRHNSESTIQLNRRRKDEYTQLCADYKTLQYKYESLINTYFDEVRAQLRTEELFLKFLQSTSTQQYIELLNDKIKQYNKERNKAIYKYHEIHRLLETSRPFKDTAELITKLDSALFDAASSYLRYKPHPANSTADRIEYEFKREYVKYRSLYENMKARYDYLFNLYPELEDYLDNDDEESLLQLDAFESFEDLQNQTDRAVDYVSKEEWNSMSKVQRYQMALDRYNNYPKSNLTIGLEYEMAVDYWLRIYRKFKTYPFGSLNGIHDLGRDIIAQKTIDNKLYTYIIQCKLRGKKKDSNEYKSIHENVVCQIYGTALVYQASHSSEIVIPTICTNVELSDTASEFAKYLHVFVIYTPKDWKSRVEYNYPQIKCNINQSTREKIYHLPFDQQYWRTLIDENLGECFVRTVQAAEDLGFRRAMRHNPYGI